MNTGNLDIDRNKLLDIMTNKDNFLNRVYFVLVGKGYKHTRGDVFYSKINGSLEIQLKLNVTDLKDGTNVIVFNEHIKRLGLKKQEVINYAFENTMRMFPPLFESVCEIVGVPDDFPFYCLTNTNKIFGAGVILYNGMYEKLKNIVGDFVIIPSSIHETIIIPENIYDDKIVSIIREINDTIVSGDEILSYRPYKLLRDCDLIEI